MCSCTLIKSVDYIKLREPESTLKNRITTLNDFDYLENITEDEFRVPDKKLEVKLCLSK